MGALIDLTGQTFGYYLVVGLVGRTKGGAALFSCQCICGVIKNVSGRDLKTGHTKSCGCKKPGPVIHGQSSTRLYNTWLNIKRRCTHKKGKDYKYYGGRGIKIYPTWAADFRNFHDWALSNGYQDGLTIERIDNSGNYEPNNCKWIPFAEQARNRRNNRLLNGILLCEAAERLNISPSTIRSRLENGWSVERAISTLAKKNKNDIEVRV